MKSDKTVHIPSHWKFKWTFCPQSSIPVPGFGPPFYNTTLPLAFAQMSAAPEEMDRSDRFQQVCQEFRECVKLADTSNGVRYDSKAGGNNDFLRRGQERHIITEEKLTRIVFGSLIPLDSAEQIREACDKVLTGLRIILLTILTCGGTLQMLDRFREHFLDAESSKTDEDLPFDVDYAKNIFGDLDGKKFYSIQLRYTAITLQEQTFHQEYRTDQILPYLSEKPLGRGTSGTVWQVRIERGHFRHHAPESHNADVSWHKNSVAGNSNPKLTCYTDRNSCSKGLQGRQTGVRKISSRGCDSRDIHQLFRLPFKYCYFDLQYCAHTQQSIAAEVPIL